MEKTTEIEVKATESIEAQYDEACKMLFLNKEIIAPVLKEVVPEYKNCTLDEIIDSIGSISSDPIDDVSVRVDALPTEDESISDKLIRYDMRFIALNPKLSNESLKIYLHIDLEIQNDYYPSIPIRYKDKNEKEGNREKKDKDGNKDVKFPTLSYPIVKRAIYYGAREISSQLGVLTGESNYAKLQKCYSIWICNKNVPKAMQNTISLYHIAKEDLLEETKEPYENYDLLSVIIIRRGNSDFKVDDKTKIFDYLNAIFASNLETIKKYVDFGRNPELEKEVNQMSGLGMSIRQDALNEGISQGFTQGITQGIEQGITKGLKQGELQKAREMSFLLYKNGMDIAKIASIANYPVEEVEKWFRESKNLTS